MPLVFYDSVTSTVAITLTVVVTINATISITISVTHVSTRDVISLIMCTINTDFIPMVNALTYENVTTVGLVDCVSATGIDNTVITSIVRT